MTPSQFRAEQMELGWQGLAMRAFDLRPSEAAILRLMMRSPGRIISFGDIVRCCESHRCVSHTPTAIRKRVERLRVRLDDVGCEGVISVVFAEGYCVQAAQVRQIEEALLFACGVDIDQMVAA